MHGQMVALVSDQRIIFFLGGPLEGAVEISDQSFTL